MRDLDEKIPPFPIEVFSTALEVMVRDCRETSNPEVARTLLSVAARTLANGTIPEYLLHWLVEVLEAGAKDNGSLDLACGIAVPHGRKKEGGIVSRAMAEKDGLRVYKRAAERLIALDIQEIMYVENVSLTRRPGSKTQSACSIWRDRHPEHTQHYSERKLQDIFRKHVTPAKNKRRPRTP